MTLSIDIRYYVVVVIANVAMARGVLFCYLLSNDPYFECTNIVLVKP